MQRSRLRFKGEVGVETHRFALDVMVHERLPLVVERHAAQIQQGLGAGERPVHPGPFHPVLDHMAAGLS